MEIFKTLFDGAGTVIISNIISFVLGGGVCGYIGYRIGARNKNRQKQKAGSNATQIQINSSKDNGN